MIKECEYKQDNGKCLLVDGFCISTTEQCIKEYNKKEQYKFEKLVMFLAKNSETGNIELDEEITKFEDAITNTKYGYAYFGIAKSDWDRIEIIDSSRIPSKYKKEGVKLYAEYYDGMQAPFTVCKWCNNFNKLEELLKLTSDLLYIKYKKEVK